MRRLATTLLVVMIFSFMVSSVPSSRGKIRNKKHGSNGKGSAIHIHSQVKG